jgi:hypothetical protein
MKSDHVADALRLAIAEQRPAPGVLTTRTGEVGAPLRSYSSCSPTAASRTRSGGGDSARTAPSPDPGSPPSGPSSSAAGRGLPSPGCVPRRSPLRPWRSRPRLLRTLSQEGRQPGGLTDLSVKPRRVHMRSRVGRLERGGTDRRGRSARSSVDTLAEIMFWPVR